MLEKVASRRIITEMTTALFRKNTAIMKMFECIPHQYIVFHHTKNQTEITLSSCSILILKRLFKFISEDSLVPYLKRGMCKDGTKLDNCDFTLP